MGLTDQFYATLDQIGHFGPFQVVLNEFLVLKVFEEKNFHLVGLVDYPLRLARLQSSSTIKRAKLCV